jgi:acetyl-CoA C-acetyltransferase
MAAIIGWSHSHFGKHPEETVETLTVGAANAAMRHAGVAAAEIDEIFIGHFNAGFSAQDFTASLVLQADPNLRFKPATRVENACATGTAAVHQGIRAIAAKSARLVLVVGVEHMTGCSAEEIGRNLLRASYLPEERDNRLGFAGVFGRIADAYMTRYGDQSDALALIAAKNHKNGVNNPFAQMRKDLGFEFCRARSERNPAGGRRAQAHRLFAGIGRRRRARARRRRAREIHAARGHVSRHGACPGFLAVGEARYSALRRLCARLETGAVRGAPAALRSLVRGDARLLHDRGTHGIRGDGLGGAGPRRRRGQERHDDDARETAVNPSGGLKAKGHPIGATGVSMHVLSAMQLCREAPEGMQVPGATIGGVFNMGGAAVANYVSILERSR